MTLGNLLSQMGIGTKNLAERHSHADYGGGSTHDSHLVYSYEPSPSHGNIASSKHHHGGSGHKSNAAMSALTLLSFLFFLHILQQCLKEHMTAMESPPVMVMTAGREGEKIIPKTIVANKLDKSGTMELGNKNDAKPDEKRKMINQNTRYDDSEDEFLTKIKTAEHKPESGIQKYKQSIINYGNRSLSYPGL